MMVWVLGVVMSLMASLAFASATAVTITGNVTAQTGAAAVRVVRQGDILRTGDVVTTAAGSSAVLWFEDGQIAALGPNSKLAIQTYEFNPQAKTGNILLNLLQGGMRAVTGLIGQANPQRVTYKAGNYTIGIRGTDVTIAVQGIQVVVTVETGVITFTVGNQVITVNAGQGALVGADGKVSTGTVSAIVQSIANNPTLLNSLQQPGALPLPITTAAGTQATATVTSTPTPTSPPGTGTGTGTGGGSPPSAR
jgi:hypothetical protein